MTTRNHHKSLLTLALLLFHSAIVTANPDPGDDECISTAANQPSANKAGGPGTIAPLASDGSATVSISVSLSDDDECDDEPVEIYVTATPATGSLGWTLSKTLDPGDSDTIDFHFDKNKISSSEEWKFTLDNDGSSIGTVTFKEGCESCGCDVGTVQGSFLVTIPTQGADGGMTRGTLYFFSHDLTFPGRAGLTAVMPPSFQVNRDNDGLLTSIDTGAGVMEFQEDLVNESITVTLKDSGNVVYRETVISLIDVDGSPHFVTETTNTVNGVAQPTIRHEQYETGPGVTVLEKGRVLAGEFVAQSHETLSKDTSTDGIEIKRTTIKERSTQTDPWQTTSDIETTWENQKDGWVKTKEIIDPDGEALTSTWSYYEPGETTGPGASIEGLGKLKRHVRHDGYESFHTYALHYESVTTPYAGIADGKSVTTTHNPGTNTTTVVTNVGAQTISKTVTKKVTTATESYQVADSYTAAGQKLTTTTHYKMQGDDFILEPLRIEHPDGTLTTYDYTRLPGGGYTTVVDKGASTDGATVSLGMRTITTVNSWGVTIHSKTEGLGYGTGSAAFGEMAVTSVDSLGRALTTARHPASVTIVGDQATAANPAWVTTTEYNCCGMSMETDKYGIPTYYAYDHLKRRIKSNRLGVTTETHYLGLTTDTHRYAETVSAGLSLELNGNASTLVSRRVGSLAGTYQESWSPDPTSVTPGALVKTSTVATYQPGAGLSSRTVTTTPDNFTQTTDSFLDGRTAATYGDLSPAMQYAYSANAGGEVTSQSYVDGGTLRETTTARSDWAGRTLRVDYMDGAFATMQYNALGQMVRSTDPDGVSTLMAYNSEGDQTLTAIDLNANGQIDYGTDTVRSSETDPAIDGSNNPVWQSVSKVWQPGETSPTVVSVNLRTPDGLAFSSQSIGVTNSSTSVTILDGNGGWITTGTAPDGTMTVQTYANGRMASSARLDGSDVILESQSQGYDALGRPVTSTHSRTGTTTSAYLSATADVVTSVTDPGSRTTGFTYDVRGRSTVTTLSDSTTTTTVYNPDGTVQESSGSQAYRTTHTYDYAQRQITLTTYGTATATTTWEYSTDRGFLTRKEYDDGNGTDYGYTDAGRLETRTWERGVVTTYGYDNNGRVTTVTYTNETNGHITPNLGYTYDALGRPLSVTRGGVAHASYTYRPGDLKLLAETQQIETLNQSVTRTYEDGTNGTLGGRPNGYTFPNGSSTYTYDTAGRHSTVRSGDIPAPGFTYAYEPNSYGLVKTLTGPQVVTTNTWEPTRDVLQSKQNDITGGTLSRFAYTVNSIGQRIGMSPSGSAFATTTPFTWGYNPRGELTSAARPGSPAFERAYTYDGIGNRLTGGAPASPSTYTPNALNQYSEIENPNSTIINPQSDPDGNMTSGPVPGANGLNPGISPPANATLTWDAENRLVKAVVNSITVDYAYDHQSRLISQTIGTATTRYLYDGWNRIAEYEDNGSGHTLKSTYLWGMDLSGSMQSAGGVGGLLAVTSHSALGTSHFYPTYDGNGNISEYVDGNGVKAAHFEYDPFGNLTVDSESNAAQFPYRYSTKPQDATTGLYYYGYRYYDPATGRWPSRDPIGERGGVNLYEFVGNDGIGRIDVLGLERAKLTVEQGENQTKNSSSKGQGHVDVEFEIEYQTYKKQHKKGKSGNKCCYAPLKITWRIVKHVNPFKNKTNEEFIKWYEEHSGKSLRDRYYKDEVGTGSYEGLNIHEDVHVKQLEAIKDEIQKNFESEVYDKETCFGNSGDRDAALKRLKKGPFAYEATEGGWTYEEAAVTAEWEYYKKIYEEFKNK